MPIKFNKGQTYLLKTKWGAIHYGIAWELNRPKGASRGELKLKNCIFKTPRLAKYAYNTINIRNIKAYKQISLSEEFIKSSTKEQLRKLLDDV